MARQARRFDLAAELTRLKERRLNDRLADLVRLAALRRYKVGDLAPVFCRLYGYWYHDLTGKLLDAQQAAASAAAEFDPIYPPERAWEIATQAWTERSCPNAPAVRNRDAVSLLRITPREQRSLTELIGSEESLRRQREFGLSSASSAATHPTHLVGPADDDRNDLPEATPDLPPLPPGAPVVRVERSLSDLAELLGTEDYTGRPLPDHPHELDVPEPFDYVAWTYRWGFRILRHALDTGAHMEIDLHDGPSRDTLVVGTIDRPSVAKAKDRPAAGFRLRDRDRTEILYVAHPPFRIDWYLPMRHSRDARARMHLAAVPGTAGSSPALSGFIRWGWPEEDALPRPGWNAPRR